VETHRSHQPSFAGNSVSARDSIDTYYKQHFTWSREIFYIQLELQRNQTMRVTVPKINILKTNAVTGTI